MRDTFHLDDDMSAPEQLRFVRSMIGTLPPRSDLYGRGVTYSVDFETALCDIGKESTFIVH